MREIQELRSKEKEELQENMEIALNESNITSKCLDNLRNDLMVLSSSVDSQVYANKLLERKAKEPEKVKGKMELRLFEMEEENKSEYKNADLQKEVENLKNVEKLLLDTQEECEYENVPSYSKRVADLEEKYSSMEGYTFKEKSLSSHLDELNQENWKLKEKVTLEESLLKQMYLEKTVEIENFQKEVEYLKEEISRVHEKRSMLTSEKSKLESSLIEVNSRTELIERELQTRHKDAMGKKKEAKNKTRGYSAALLLHLEVEVGLGGQSAYSRRSGRRHGKEVVVEPDNNDKYIDVNNETSDDDFVDLGRNSAYASGKKSLHGCLDNGLNCDRIHYCLRRSGRNKDKEVYDSDHAKTVASRSKGKTEKQGRKRSRETKGNPNRDDEMVRNWKQQYGDSKEIKPDDVRMRMRKSNEVDLNFKLNFIVLFTSIMGNISKKGVCDTSILDYITPNTNLSNVNGCEYVWRALKTCKKGWKKSKKDSYFRGPLTVLTMCYVDCTKCNDNIVCRRRPPTKVWTVELLSEREAEELSCGGFGYGELEEDFVEEEGDLIPNNIENITKEQKGFEKLLTAAEHMFPGNVNLIGFADKYINSLKCTWGGNNSGTNAKMHHTKKKKDVQGEAGCPNMNRVEALNEVGFRVQRNEEVEDGVSDIGVNEQTQENMCRVLTQKAFESVADEVERSIEKTKIMEIDDRPSFSFGVTQDFDVIPVTDNEKKVLTPMPISAYTPEGKARDVFMFNGKRVTSKSNIMRSPFYSRVADLDVALSSEESKVTKYLFLTSHDSYTDILFKSKSGQQSDRLQMESMGKDYVETNILDTWVVVCNYMEEYRSNDSPFRLFLSTFVVVFLPIDNEGHRFLLSFDLKYEAVTMFDQKKDKILKKSKLRKGAKIGNNIVAEMLINFGRYLYGLDHIKSRNIITPELEIVEYDWQTAMNDATILMSDCNVLKEQVKAHMDHASGSMLSDVHLNKGQVKIK
ncbi:hypothetical protein Tco_1524736 [Tanacetum coccineum]